MFQISKEHIPNAKINLYKDGDTSSTVKVERKLSWNKYCPLCDHIMLHYSTANYIHINPNGVENVDIYQCTKCGHKVEEVVKP